MLNTVKKLKWVAVVSLSLIACAGVYYIVYGSLGQGSGDVRIGVASIQWVKDTLSVSIPGDPFRFEYKKPNTIMEYAFMLRTHKPVLTGCDGVVTPGDDVIPFPEDRPLAASDIPRFAFFSSSPDTMGFLVGGAGASGGSGQWMILLDTKSGAHTVIEMFDLAMPIWLDEQLPPSYADVRIFSLGCHSLSLGYAPRLWHAYVFKSGQYVRDQKNERRLCQKQFEAVRLTVNDQKEMMEKTLEDIDRNSGERLMDYIYYGVRSGNTPAVQKLISRLPAGTKQEVEAMIPHMTE